MKIKEKKINSTENATSAVKVTNGGTVEKKRNKKKKENFEVRIPRIIVRNLDFKVREDRLKKKFEELATAPITNVSIATRDGTSKGFGFITFEKLEDAQKAIQEMNGKKILGRPMAVDWSLPKDVYEKMHVKEPVRSDSYGFQSNKAEDKPSVKEEVEEEEEEEEEDEEEEMVVSEKLPNKVSRDVREHRTLFVRNLPFDATEDEITELLSSNKKYRIRSCLLVIDPVSRHPRGSAFVQFATADEAQECLQQSFTLRSQKLYLDLALSRNDLSKARDIREKKKENSKKHDQRNLELAKIGVILNLADLGGNESDLRKRQQLEDVKKMKLKNPLHFVSQTRLTMHNLPPSVDDKQLRKLVLDTLKKDQIPLKDVKLTECRIMKQNKDSKKSLAYGFINFTRHEHALRTLELMNNNQHIFGPHRRPIIQFAIENRRALQLKEQRRERLHAKEELLKDPTKKVLAFEGEKKKRKENRLQSMNSQLNQTRLSDLVQNDEGQEEEEEEEGEYEENSIDVPDNIPLVNQKQTKKRRKRKSKAEIRDQLDRMIDNTRNKRPLPSKTSKKWFE